MLSKMKIEFPYPRIYDVYFLIGDCFRKRTLGGEGLWDLLKEFKDEGLTRVSSKKLISNSNFFIERAKRR